jgi:hypothetical protein
MAVHASRLNRKAGRELPQPLLTQAGRSQHEHALDRPPRAQLGRDEAGLDRLAQADLVREEDASAEAPKDGERRLELVWKEIDPRRPRGAQRSRRAIGGDQRTAGTPPGDGAHAARPRLAIDRVYSVEWNEDAALQPELWSGKAAQREDLTVFVRADMDNPPACSAHEYEIARPNCCTATFRRWRNLHRASATRAQIVRRAFSAAPDFKNLRPASGRRSAQGQSQCLRAPRLVVFRKETSDERFKAGLFRIVKAPLVTHRSRRRGRQRLLGSWIRHDEGNRKPRT